MDDLIFSGAGSGCAGDDEDVECSPNYDLTSDDLITPVYVAPTKSPFSVQSKNKKENIKERPTCDDEEDCEEGSGSDPGTTDTGIIVSSTSKPLFFKMKYIFKYTFKDLFIYFLFRIKSSVLHDDTWNIDRFIK